MINLIKNELIKIFHKKGLWILSFVICFMMFLSLIVDTRYSSSYSGINKEHLKEQYDYYSELLEKTDPNTEKDTLDYVTFKTFLDTYSLLLECDEDELAKYYYIENEVNSVIYQMYQAKYISKSDTEYLEYKNQYDEILKKLDNYDWKKELENERKEFSDTIKELKMEMALPGALESDIQSRIDNMNIRIKAIDYRLEYEVPRSYTYASDMIDEYENSAITYAYMNKDESTYKKRSDLIEKRENEKRYKIAEYKLENGLIEEENKEQLIDSIVDIFSYVDTIVLLALLIVCGSIVSDEFNKGTIKQLLVRPFTRSQILLSKIIASVIAILLFALLYYSVDILCLSISYDNYTALFSNTLSYNFNTQQVVEMNLVLYCLLKILAILPVYLIIFAFIIFMGVLTTSTIGAVASGFGLFFFSELLNVYLLDNILAFIPTFCWDMSPYLLWGLSSNPYSSLEKSIIVCVITLVVLIGASFLVFKNKDIKNQ